MIEIIYIAGFYLKIVTHLCANQIMHNEVTQNIIDNYKYSLEASYHVDNQRMGAVFGELKQGKGINFFLYSNLLKNDGIQQINQYLYNSPEKVNIKFKSEQFLCGPDTVTYMSEQIEEIVDFSNFCSIAMAFIKILPNNEKDLFISSVHNAVKKTLPQFIDKKLFYFNYLCPYGTILKVNGNEIHYAYRGKLSTYSVKIDINKTHNINKLSDSLFIFRKQNKTIFPSSQRPLMTY